MSSNYTYYIYAYIRAKDSATAKAGTPYYIGKGKGNRYAKSHPNTTVPKDKEHILFLFENLCESDAYAKEKELISKYGRKIDNSGILHNIQEGGIGGAGGLVATLNHGTVSKEIFDNTDEMVGVNSGKSIYTNGKEYKILSPDDNLVLSGEYVRTSEGKCVVVDTTGNHRMVTIEEKEELGLISMNKGKVAVRDKSGNKFTVEVNDKRIQTGELSIIVGSKNVLRHKITGEIKTINRGEDIPIDYVHQNNGGYKNLVTLSDGLKTFRVFLDDPRIGKTLFPFKRVRSGKIILKLNHI
jgi:hypothetical protein